MLRNKLHPSAARVRALFDCDPDTGQLVAKTRRSNHQTRGAAASPNKKGYLRACVDGRLYYVHHLVWLHVTGEWPDELDHRDLDVANNAMSNLRKATRSQNGANQRIRKRNTSGFKGAQRGNGKFVSKLGKNGKSICLGTFDRPEDAHNAYVEAAYAHFGDFARGG